MNIYSIALFLHVTGALGFFIALGLEWTSLQHLRRATTADQIREWKRVPDEMGRLGMISMVTILAAGFYMMFKAWGRVPWITVTLGAIVLLIILAMGITRRRLAAIGEMVDTERGFLPPTLIHLVRDPVLWISMQTRVAIALGIIFLMTVKPGLGGSLLTIGIAIVFGLASALPMPRHERVQEKPSG